MTSEMIAIVARAMAMADSGPEGSQLYDLHWREFGPAYLQSARIAITAMRDPPDEMLMAPGLPYGGMIDRINGIKQRREAWQAMIDVALGAPSLTSQPRGSQE